MNSILKQRLFGHKIVIGGYNKECMEFYLAYHRQLDIVGYINFNHLCRLELKQDEVFANGEEKLGLQELSLDQVDVREYFIVVCNGFSTPNWYDEYKQFDEVLYLKGYEYENDYIDAIVVYRLFRDEEWVKHFENKEFLVFGCGKCGQTFYKRFCKQYKIVGFLSNNENEVECMGLPVYRVTKDNIGERKIVICSVYKLEMMQQLESLGLCCYADYITHKMLIGKIFVDVGTCHVQQSAIFLNYRETFTIEYSKMSFIYTVQERNLVGYEIERVKRLLKYADVVYCLAAFPGTGHFYSFADYVQRYDFPCKVVKIANYVFQGLHPQATVLQMKEANPYCVRLDVFSDYQYNWLYGDSNINGYILDGKTDDEIIEILSADDYFDEAECEENLQLSLRMLAKFDMVSDIKLYSFVKENYRTRMLFRDMSHFTAFALLEISRQVLDILNIEDDLDIKMKEDLAKSVMMGTYLPIYPSVAQALQLNMEEMESECCIVRSDYSVEMVNFEEWTRRYCNYVRAIKAAKENDAV